MSAMLPTPITRLAKVVMCSKLLASLVSIVSHYIGVTYPTVHDTILTYHLLICVIGLLLAVSMYVAFCLSSTGMNEQ